MCAVVRLFFTAGSAICLKKTTKFSPLNASTIRQTQVSSLPSTERSGVDGLPKRDIAHPRRRGLRELRNTHLRERELPCTATTPVVTAAARRRARLSHSRRQPSHAAQRRDRHALPPARAPGAVNCSCPGGGKELILPAPRRGRFACTSYSRGLT